MPPKRSPKKTATKSSSRAKGVIRGFKTKQDFADWLERNHGNTEGILLRIAKKDSGLKSITYQEALEIALCYGWIDAIKLPENDKTWLQRFLPRRAKSIWSKINRDKAIALIESGLMRPPGHAEIERAKNDGRWEAAYDSPAKAQAPAEFLAALDRNPKAKAFFETISRSNRYAITWRLATAKTPEKRERLLRTFIDMLEKGKTLH